MKVQKTEVSELCTKNIQTETDIDNLPLAFESARKTLKFWLADKNHNKK